MSKTKRFDDRKTRGKRPTTMMWGEVFVDDTPEWKHTRDKKRWNKCPKWYKQMKERSRRAARNQEVKNLRAGNINEEQINLPKEPRGNDWDWT
jgi:hypothetical protein